MEKSVKITGIIVLGLVVVALIISNSFSNVFPSETITVNGQSEIEVTPNLVTTYFSIENTADTASEARDATSQTYNQFISALVLEGISEEDIKTTNFQVRQQYEWENEQYKEKGYVAIHNVKVELPIDESDKVGDIIDAGVDAGALINYVNFELTEDIQEEKKAEAIQKATEDARTKAESIADGLGANLGSIVSVSDSNFDYYPWPLYDRAAGGYATSEDAVDAAVSSTANINPSEQVIYGNVRVIYKIR